MPTQTAKLAAARRSRRCQRDGATGRETQEGDEGRTLGQQRVEDDGQDGEESGDGARLDRLERQPADDAASRGEELSSARRAGRGAQGKRRRTHFLLSTNCVWILRRFQIWQTAMAMSAAAERRKAKGEQCVS